ncbi:MAG: acetyl-CoA carboxylase carboxyl transferase subunit alpha, partial [Hyphomicrobiaceae bacterium]|nr:acetyl-CoA carboxylase carboxyl transferase subunit alpha [Hyphomicrobiaceae bacterium]
RASDAATALKITAQDLKGLGVIDHIVDEPMGGAHRDHAKVLQAVGDAVEEMLSSLEGYAGDAVRDARQEKFLAIGRTL